MNRVDELWRRRDVPASAKLIFALIHYYAEEKEDGIVRPTADTIGEETGLSVRTVREGLKVLWEQGFIEREAAKERCNIAGWQVVRQKLSNQYMVTPAKVAAPKQVVRQKLPNQDAVALHAGPAWVRVDQRRMSGRKRSGQTSRPKRAKSPAWSTWTSMRFRSQRRMHPPQGHSTIQRPPFQLWMRRERSTTPATCQSLSM